MPATEIRESLFCSFCGQKIGAVEVCPHCNESNDFLDVTPPRSVFDERARKPSDTTKVARPAVIPAPPVVAAEAPEKDEDGPTVVLRLPDDEDPTVSLKKKEEPAVVGILISQDGKGDELRHELREGSMTVGRKNAQILIPRDTVSKKHALIEVERKGADQYTITVMDRGSENSTYVNDVRLEPNQKRTLADQDMVKFADVTYRLSIRG